MCMNIYVHAYTTVFAWRVHGEHTISSYSTVLQSLWEAIAVLVIVVVVLLV